MNEGFSHFPVLLKETIEYLRPGRGDTILDATLGGGGHARRILEEIAPEGKLIAVDRDPEAIDRARAALKEYNSSVIYVNRDFREIDSIIEEAAAGAIDGAVFDLGVSSYQIDDPEKGFSFRRDGPLDMRFNRDQKTSAKDVVNHYKAEEIEDIIRDLGEERHARSIAQAICLARVKKSIETTGELADVIKRKVASRYRRQRIHPAARTFQALRIFVNDELASVEEGVSKALSYLRPGKRICVISFHSLEDRIIKRMFNLIKVITKKQLFFTGKHLIVLIWKKRRELLCFESLDNVW